MGACGTDALLTRFVPVPIHAGAAATSQHVSVQVLVLLNRGARGSTGLEAARVYVRAAAAGRLRLVLLRLHDGLGQSPEAFHSRFDASSQEDAEIGCSYGCSCRMGEDAAGCSRGAKMLEDARQVLKS
jgi:hypothetical protein